MKLCILYTFAKKNIANTIDRAHAACEGKAELDIFLDSGAYSAFTLGLNLDIDDYIQLIYKYKDKITCYCNFDVVDDINKTLVNQRIMEDSGLRPVPVFQYRTDFGFARELAQHYDHVALSGPGALSWNAYSSFVRMAVSVMRKANPSITIHGFGITKPDVLTDVEFDSVDSASWNAGQYGCVWLYHPKRHHMRSFQRANIGVIARDYRILSESLSHYGLSISDFIKRRAIQQYSWAALKGFLNYAEYLTNYWKHEFKIYFADIEPSILKRPGLLEYILAPLDGTADPLHEFFQDRRKHDRRERIRSNRRWEREIER